MSAQPQTLVCVVLLKHCGILLEYCLQTFLMPCDRLALAVLRAPSSLTLKAAFIDFRSLKTSTVDISSSYLCVPYVNISQSVWEKQACLFRPFMSQILPLRCELMK